MEITNCSIKVKQSNIDAVENALLADDFIASLIAERESERAKCDYAGVVVDANDDTPVWRQIFRWFGYSVDIDGDNWNRGRVAMEQKVQLSFFSGSWRQKKKQEKLNFL